MLTREVAASQGELTDEQRKIARLRGDLSALRGKFQSSQQESEIQNKLEGELVSAQQELTEEMKRLLGSQYRRPTTDAIGGIPVDSEYIIFIIDTSGSMFNYVWPTLLKKIEETLNIYPKVKGFQVMSDEGGYMFPSYRGKWLPDTPVQRKAVIDRLRNWTPFSNSSPVEGIVEAIRTYYSKDKKISLYVFGDEFTGSSIDSVVKTVDMINREDKTGAAPRAHPRDRLPGAPGCAAVHERPLRDADAHPVPAQRRHLRGDRQVMKLFHGVPGPWRWRCSPAAA